MNQEQFIEAIRIAVAQSSQHSMKSILIEPPGRVPYPEDVELSNWYNNLSEPDKQMVLKVVKQTADMTVFGFLCVLDSVRAIEDGRHKGKLDLYYNKGDISVHLNGPKEDLLHELW